jgi:hypothetical protein
MTRGAIPSASPAVIRATCDGTDSRRVRPEFIALVSIGFVISSLAAPDSA